MATKNFTELSEMVANTERPRWIEKQAAAFAKLGISRIAERVCGFILGFLCKLQGMSRREVALLKLQWLMQKEIKSVPADRAIEFSIGLSGKRADHWHRREVGWTVAGVLKEIQQMFLALPEGEFGRTGWAVRTAKEKPADSDEKPADGGTLADAVGAQTAT
mgnify:CR=1 FL=1